MGWIGSTSVSDDAMLEADIKPFDHPAAWKATDFASSDDFAVDLTARQLDALESDTARLKEAGGRHKDVTAKTFPLAAIREDVAGWRDEIRHGRGLLMLRGFPVERLDAVDLRLMFLGLGAHIGRPTSQSAMGDLVGDVINIGDDDRNERAYRSRRELKLHTDRCDHIGMLCIRPAMTGGVSGYASALAIHNEMLSTRPDLLAYLYRGYFHHRFGEQAPGEPVVTRDRIPIFSVTDGVPSVILIRGYIDLAAQEGHVTLSAAETEALDVFEEIGNRPEFRLDMTLEPGEATFTNNCCVLHTRTAFEDSDDVARKRLLLRLWLREDGRPAAPGVVLHKGYGGIAKRDGKGTYYTPATGASR
jgi:hypothetical protein